MISFSAYFQNYIADPNANHIATSIALRTIDLPGAIIVGLIITGAVLVSLPGIVVTSKSYLGYYAWINIVSLLATMIYGLRIWYTTLVERASFSKVWTGESQETRAYLQDRFGCCGYYNATSPLYTPSAACSSDDVAASMVGCVGPFVSYLDIILNRLFTTMFGFLGIGLVALLTSMMVMKQRTEAKRFKVIAMKHEHDTWRL